MRQQLNKKAENRQKLREGGNMIVINSDPWEVRVAHIEKGRVTNLLVERAKERTPVGNIYKGKVVRVLPGMQAAFVDIGLERTGFLYVAEIHDELNDFTENGSDEFELQDDDELPTGKYKGQQIQDMIKEGQEIIVQVSKAPMGTKGARLTCHVSIPGRSLVLMPTMNHTGISRRISDDSERRRLRDIVNRLRRRNEGLIARTAAEGKTAKSLREDVGYLHRLWTDIQKRAERAQAPSTIYTELSLPVRAVRDLLSSDIKKIHVDDPETHKQISEFIRTFIPKKSKLVERYQGERSIFETFDIERSIHSTMEKKVWLKSGGYLIIEQTEALVAIDVNTGRFTGDSKSFDDTIFKTNLEAVAEIVHQLRLRNIGGIIILDLIDMDRAAHREKVYRALEQALREDKARTKISRITNLGLVEMTRKRTEENIGQALTDRCPYCEGDGRIKSKQSVCYELFRALMREARSIKGPKIFVNVHPDLARMLRGEESKHLRIIEERTKKKIVINRDAKLHMEDFEVHA